MKEKVFAALAARGLDLAAAMPSAAYDAEVAPALRLPTFGRASALAIVVGNTRALWPRVVAARAAGAVSARDPVDEVVVAGVTAALDEACGGARWQARWAHDAPVTVAIQRAAAVAGLAYLAPSHLCVHPTFGPWIALRAVVVVDVDEPADARPAPVAAPCDCARGCGAALDRALALGAPSGQAELRERWRAWLAVRDACPVGRAHRYGDDQILWHYAGIASEPE